MNKQKRDRKIALLGDMTHLHMHTHTHKPTYYSDHFIYMRWNEYNFHSLYFIALSNRTSHYLSACWLNLWAAALALTKSTMADAESVSCTIAVKKINVIQQNSLEQPWQWIGSVLKEHGAQLTKLSLTQCREVVFDCATLEGRVYKQSPIHS